MDRYPWSGALFMYLLCFVFSLFCERRCGTDKTQNKKKISAEDPSKKEKSSNCIK